MLQTGLIQLLNIYSSISEVQQDMLDIQKQIPKIRIQYNTILTQLKDLQRDQEN